MHWKPSMIICQCIFSISWWAVSPSFLALPWVIKPWSSSALQGTILNVGKIGDRRACGGLKVLAPWAVSFLCLYAYSLSWLTLESLCGLRASSWATLSSSGALTCDLLVPGICILVLLVGQASKRTWMAHQALVRDAPFWWMEPVTQQMPHSELTAAWQPAQPWLEPLWYQYPSKITISLLMLYSEHWPIYLGSQFYSLLSFPLLLASPVLITPCQDVDRFQGAWWGPNLCNFCSLQKYLQCIFLF